MPALQPTRQCQSHQCGQRKRRRDQIRVSPNTWDAEHSRCEAKATDRLECRQLCSAAVWEYASLVVERSSGFGKQMMNTKTIVFVKYTCDSCCIGVYGHQRCQRRDSWITLTIFSVVTNTHFQVFKYFGKYLVSDEYLNTVQVFK